MEYLYEIFVVKPELEATNMRLDRVQAKCELGRFATHVQIDQRELQIRADRLGTQQCLNDWCTE